MRSSASRRARRLAGEARLLEGSVNELELVGRLAALVRGPGRGRGGRRGFRRDVRLRDGLIAPS